MPRPCSSVAGLFRARVNSCNNIDAVIKQHKTPLQHLFYSIGHETTRLQASHALSTTAQTQRYRRGLLLNVGAKLQRRGTWVRYIIKIILFVLFRMLAIVADPAYFVLGRTNQRGLYSTLFINKSFLIQLSLFRYT